jgi:hypothetical protein
MPRATRLGLSLHTRYVSSSMGPAAGAIELLNSSSKIHGRANW